MHIDDPIQKGIRMKKIFWPSSYWLMIFSFLVSACGAGGGPLGTTPEVAVENCGNGTCEDPETTETCPVDCTPQELIEPQPTPTEEIDPLGYITFVVNVHDIINLADSAETLLKLIDLFEEHGVKGDFFLTGPMTHAYIEGHPEVIQRLKETGMTISYHVQPPHPLVPDFQGPLQVGAVNVKLERIANYESQRLDMTTGGLIAGEPGGYLFLQEIFGAPPSAVYIPDDPIKGFALPHFTGIGAQMVVLYHQSGTSIEQPYAQDYGMWVRPVDIPISHWTSADIDASMAWWDMLATEYAASYQPVSRLQDEIESWSAERLPFIIVTIDEYNFYREGPPPWTMIYYQAPGTTQPNSPPFNLDAQDLTLPRSPENEKVVWDAYVALVEWAATYMQVVTSADIVDMATTGE
jgi:hypothetical protein